MLPQRLAQNLRGKEMLIEDKHKSPDSSHLFTIRVWVESVNKDTRQVRIQVKHVLSGATHTFLQWAQVIEFIEAQLLEHASDKLRREK
jgi:hypothetical protein